MQKSTDALEQLVQRTVDREKPKKKKKKLIIIIIIPVTLIYLSTHLLSKSLRLALLLAVRIAVPAQQAFEAGA